MKTFEEICGLNQAELKGYLKDYLSGKGYECIAEDGFLYVPAKKDNAIPVLVTAHLDTVHKKRIETIEKVSVADPNLNVKTKISSPEGIGGDDRCGVYMILNIIEECNVPVLFCEDEEIGMQGAKKFIKTKYAKELAESIKYMIELDRQGSTDAVFYSCDNKEFTDWIEKNSGYKFANGSCSDISTLMPSLKIAGVNFSCGYYNAHTTNEYVYLEEMNDTMNMVCDLLKKEIPQKFEYVEKKYSWGTSRYGGNWGNFDYGKYAKEYEKYTSSYSKPKKTKNRFNRDTMVTLTVFVNYYGEELYGFSELYATGATKPECWMNLFMDYDELCFAYIEDYTYE